MTQPIDQLVSIILPVRNGQDTLVECLDSLLAQTYEPLEIIAIDDNSKDKSYSILRKYRLKDKRLVISRNVKQYGLTVTLNRSLKKAKGSYISFMNQSDIVTPDKLKRQINYLKRHPKVAVVGTQTTWVQEDGSQLKSIFPTDDQAIAKTFLTSDALQLESIVINRYLLPRDLLKFTPQQYPVVFRSLLTKIKPYGMFANLNQHLYIRRATITSQRSDMKKAFHHFQLWTKARFLYGTGISLNSLFYPINNKIKSTI